MLTSDLGATLEQLESFQGVWSSFARSYWNLSGKAQIEPREEAAFHDLLRGVLERYGRLKEGAIGIPGAFVEGMEAIGAYRGFGSLSDRDASALRDGIMKATQELEVWIEGLKRKTTFRAGLSKTQRRETIRVWVLVPVFFGVLLGFFVFFGVKFFLNRW